MTAHQAPLSSTRSRSAPAFLAATSALALLGCAWQGTVRGVVDEDEVQENVHSALFEETGDRYPSAAACRTCHPDHYREWSVSPHAYAQLSPVFNAMHGTILASTSGTFGDFCIRCHTPVGMALGEPLFAPNAERDPVSREGVTCIVCHRVDASYGKNSGRNPIIEGDLLAPVYGPRDGSELERVKANPDEFGPLVDTRTDALGRRVHAEARFFAPISESGFCGRCHDVTFVNGFRLEEAFSEYKASPAAARGESCQDCHMGHTPGIAAGYDEGPAAVVGGVPTATRKRTNHMFVGPDYSVVHPGIFPHNPEAQELASMEEWTQFDWRAGWGTDEFEDAVADGEIEVTFPKHWEWPDDRYEAREVIEDQLALLEEVHAQGTELLQRGYVLGDVTVRRADDDGLAFDVEVRNGTDGHNAPTGFIAERLVFLRVTVRDARGEVVFESGDADPNGDVRDLHSLYVHDGLLPLDTQLFSLQSRFLVRMVRGGEREQILSVNYSPDPLPFARPAPNSSILTGRPGGSRIHKMGIAPGDARVASYSVSEDELTGFGPYTAHVELVAGMVPVNLIHEIHRVGFDYGMSARDVADALLAGHRVLHERTIVLEER